jgi:hypothetical protein
MLGHYLNQRSESTPSLGTRSANEEAAKAKTEALKKFLRSIQTQRSESDSTSHANLLPGTGSPASGPPPNFIRSNSTSSMPMSSSSPTGSAIRNSPKYSAGQQSPPPLVKASTQQRPLSSSLRREVKHDSNSEFNELPSTPTPTRSYKSNGTTPSQYNHTNTQQTRDIPNIQQNPPKKFQPEDALRVLAGQNSNNVHVMENELRRILKLDLVSGSGGASGFPN